jgi:hypothetical protein
MLAPSLAQRDTLTQQLRDVAQRSVGSGAEATVRVDSLVAQALDRGFRAAFDQAIPVTREAPSRHGRMVLGEFTTGLKCGACWLHDRLYALLLQRYPRSDFVVLAYHGGIPYPIVTDADSLWTYISNLSGTPTPALYTPQGFFTANYDMGWIDGRAMRLGRGESTAVQHKFDRSTAVIDRELQVAPAADVALVLTPRGVTDTSLAGIDVQVRVTLHQPRPHLGVRLALVEDTVRVTGFTNRRLQYFPVRTVAWFSHAKHDYTDLFAPLPAASTTPTTVTYQFDVTKLQESLLALYQSDEDARTKFPALENWRLHPRRLGVVAIVQDMDTREVLQTAYQRVLPLIPSGSP